MSADLLMTADYFQRPGTWSETLRNASYQCQRMEQDSRLETDLAPHRSAGTEGIVKLHSKRDKKNILDS